MLDGLFCGEPSSPARLSRWTAFFSFFNIQGFHIKIFSPDWPIVFKQFNRRGKNMNELAMEAEEILGVPNKMFSLAGISEDGSLVDATFNFRQFRDISENYLPDHSGSWIIIPRDKCLQYGIPAKSDVKFSSQTLVEIHQRGFFTDCVWLENRIKEYDNSCKFGGRELPSRKRFILDIMSRMKKKMLKQQQ